MSEYKIDFTVKPCHLCEKEPKDCGLRVYGVDGINEYRVDRHQWLPQEPGQYAFITWFSETPVEGLHEADFITGRVYAHGMSACAYSFKDITGINVYNLDPKPFYYYTTYIRLGDL